ncbi:MAG: ribosome-associated translation inhibitor RaiA [Chthoniobacter sp.]|uniref:ribosome hibernation-promoting factor, HPF/YfiA family n=1 Tax=Chthoniobacter sp. TaxID=2510640 RepID=UPI0032A5DD85
MNHTNMTTMPIHITPHHLSLSPALRAFVYEKLNGLSRAAIDVLSADVVLRRHHGTSEGKRYSASARLALPGRDLHASATHANLYSAVVKLVTRLARLSRKRKTRLAKSFIKRGSAFTADAGLRKMPDALESPSIDLAPHPAERTPQNREGGQEMRVFGFRRDSPFALAADASA